MNSLNIVQKYYPNVTSVEDATQILEVEVKPCDITSSKIKNQRGCVFARAVKRNYQITGAVIAVSTAYLISGSKATRYSIPPSLSKEIVAFDRAGKFEPGEYYINKPQFKLDTPRTSKRPMGKRSTNKDAKKKKYHKTQAIRSIHKPN